MDVLIASGMGDDALSIRCDHDWTGCTMIGRLDVTLHDTTQGEESAGG